MYGGSDTLSNSRGTGLVGDGSEGVMGNELVGPKKLVHPLPTASHEARQNARAMFQHWELFQHWERRKRERIMAFLSFALGEATSGAEPALALPPNR